MKNPT